MSNSSIVASPPDSEAPIASDISVRPQLQENKRSAGKGRRRRAVAEQELWSDLVDNVENYIYVAPHTPPLSRRQRRRAARRSSREHWAHAEDDHLDTALAHSLSMHESPHWSNVSMDSSTLPEHQHLDMSFESLALLENVTCTVPVELVRSFCGHIFRENSVVPTSSSADEICTICQDEYNEGDSCMTLPCAHTFHDGCGLRWFLQYSKLCPVCKYDIMEHM